MFCFVVVVIPLFHFRDARLLLLLFCCVMLWLSLCFISEMQYYCSFLLFNWCCCYVLFCYVVVIPLFHFRDAILLWGGGGGVHTTNHVYSLRYVIYAYDSFLFLNAISSHLGFLPSPCFDLHTLVYNYILIHLFISYLVIMSFFILVAPHPNPQWKRYNWFCYLQEMRWWNIFGHALTFIDIFIIP